MKLRKSAHHSQFWRHKLHVLKAGVNTHEDIGTPAHQQDPQRHIGVKLENNVQCMTVNIIHQYIL